MALASSTQRNGQVEAAKLSGRARGLIAVGGLLLFTVVVLIIWGGNLEVPWSFRLTVGGAIDDGVRWAVRNGDFIFDPFSDAVLIFFAYLRDFLLWVPWPTMVIALTLIAGAVAGRNVAIFAAVGLLLVAWAGLWPSAMETVSLIAVSVVMSISVAVPIGIVAARSNRVDAVLRPILDAMQTMPSFVYLVPAIMFFGLREVPAIVATIIYATPPGIRLTSLGIRQVSPEIVEAARSFGTTPRQLLFKVQIPMAVPTIMAGINQVIMMALAMVVIASMVGAGGLGEDVLRALQRQRPGEALLSGSAIVVLAVLVDRITQAMAKSRQQALAGSKTD